MKDWTDNAPEEFKKVVDDAMSEGHHRNFPTYYDFLRACVDTFEQEEQDLSDLDKVLSFCKEHYNYSADKQFNNDFYKGTTAAYVNVMNLVKELKRKRDG